MKTAGDSDEASRGGGADRERDEWGQFAVTSSSFVAFAARSLQRLPFQIEPVSAVDQSIEHGIGDGGITEHLWMPQRLTGESLRCGWLIRTILFMASVFRSAVAVRDGDRG
jgi:hypothetical protein